MLVEDELAGCTFNDGRLGQRLHRLVARMDRSLGASLPFACQDWANTKAAYRFFANQRVSEAQILSGHFAATRERVRASDGTVLVLQDTTEFTFQRESREAVGITRRVNSGRDKAGQVRLHTLCGLLMHGSLAVTTDGLDLPRESGELFS
ncbi:IS4/Tn5 family transposase DNA-binding protein [Methylobacterium phyllosphaerae]